MRTHVGHSFAVYSLGNTRSVESHIFALYSWTAVMKKEQERAPGLFNKKGKAIHRKIHLFVPAIATGSPRWVGLLEWWAGSSLSLLDVQARYCLLLLEHDTAHPCEHEVYLARPYSNF